MQSKLPFDLGQGMPVSRFDEFPATLRGFGPIGFAAVLVIFAGNFIVVPLSALLVLAWVSYSQTPSREIGYVRPRSWLVDAAIGILFGVALKLLMKSVVMPLLGASDTNPAYQFLVGNTAAVPGMLFLVIVGAGWGEETLFRGYLFERFGKLLGQSRAALSLTVMLTALLFGWAHYPDQGIAGVQQALLVGLIFGFVYARYGRLWLLMCAHAAFDLVALAIIYWDQEAAVAHWRF
jgi:membrane protease YdiL (CAAX protease family)